MTIYEQIKKADAKIAEIEAALIVAHEHRRELVNRGNLNKCDHIPDWDEDGVCHCVECGRELLW